MGEGSVIALFMALACRPGLVCVWDTAKRLAPRVISINSAALAADEFAEMGDKRVIDQVADEEHRPVGQKVKLLRVRRASIRCDRCVRRRVSWREVERATQVS